MDAPTFPPAVAYVAPQRIATPYDTPSTAIATLQADQAAWNIVLAEIPNVESRLGNPQIKPHLGNFSFRSVVQFGIVAPEALDRIDARLRSLEPRR